MKQMSTYLYTVEQIVVFFAFLGTQSNRHRVIVNLGPVQSSPAITVLETPYVSRWHYNEIQKKLKLIYIQIIYFGENIGSNGNIWNINFMIFIWLKFNQTDCGKRQSI